MGIGVRAARATVLIATACAGLPSSAAAWEAGDRIEALDFLNRWNPGQSERDWYVFARDGGVEASAPPYVAVGNYTLKRMQAPSKG